MSDPGEGSGEEDGVEVGEPGIAMLIGRQLAWEGTMSMLPVSCFEKYLFRLCQVDCDLGMRRHCPFPAHW